LTDFMEVHTLFTTKPTDETISRFHKIADDLAFLIGRKERLSYAKRRTLARLQYVVIRMAEDEQFGLQLRALLPLRDMEADKE